MSDANRCPSCGAERPADAPEGLCPRCLERNALDDETALPTDDDAVVGPETAVEPTSEWSQEPQRPLRIEDTDGDGDVLPRGTNVRYFGDYEIRRELGRGGMGVVFEARQVSLNRPVALKMLRAGVLAGGDELRRFQNEAEAIALLDHPGIVPVYEVGEHQGQHYFSMKLVGGGSLVPLIERYKDDPKAAARLVAEASEAVAHAHARGILHRDLKPANILVDEEGRPHVTDFGLAKRVEGDGELTQSGAILGTPAYMAPEQATGRRGSVTTATDVYGLGAVLYALLTGRAPFVGDSVVETLDAVRTRPPEPPARLNPRVPRDLETICLKCLEKDPRRRYATAQALADELRAWLDARPISARRVGAAERAWLWCRRKPAVAALAAAVALAVVGGAAATIAVQARANAALRSKNDELTAAYGREAEANAGLAEANRRVEQRYKLAVEAIKTFHTGVSEDFLLKEDRFKALRDRLLKSAADFYGKLSALLGRETDLASRRALTVSNFELADLTFRVGRRDDALAAHRSVLAARRALVVEPGAGAAGGTEVGRSLTSVAGLLAQTGKTEEALPIHREAEALLAGLAAESPEARAVLADCRTQLGALLVETGKSAEGLAAYRLARADLEALAGSAGATDATRLDLVRILGLIGRVLAQTDRPREAEAEFRRALEIQRAMADTASPRFQHIEAQGHNNLGYLLSGTGSTSEAEAEFHKALAIWRALSEASPAVTEFRVYQARGHTGLAWLLSRTGRPKEAEVEYRRALSLRRELAEANRAVVFFRSDLAQSHGNLGILLSRTGRHSEAESAFRDALAIYRELVEANPDVLEFRMFRSENHHNLGALLSRTGRRAEAEAEYRQALSLEKALAEANRGVADFRSRMANTHNSIGVLMWQAGRRAEAESEYRAALEIFRELTEATPTVTRYRNGLADSQANLARLLADSGRPKEAEAEYRRALTLLRALAEANPAVTDFRRNLADTHESLGRLLSGTIGAEAAEAEYRAALVLHRALAESNPTDIRARSGLARHHSNLGRLLAGAGRPEQAEAEYRAALALNRALAEATPTVSEIRAQLAYNHLVLGRLLGRAGRNSEAEAEHRAALAIYGVLAEQNPQVPDYRDVVAACHTSIADLLRSRGQSVQARDGYDRAIAIREALARELPRAPSYRSNQAYSLRRRGLARRDLGDQAGAASDARRALELYDALPSRSSDEWYETACCNAALTGSSASGGSDPAEADRAMERLHRAVGMGYRDLNAFRTEAALGPLRDREDFRLLMMDLAMPADAFPTAR
jgi:tetratricopeptide (TPR) repeat protein